MGCTQSKIDNEEAVQRCKDRKLFMKDAVSYRNAFAAAHSAYAMSLKNTGAALHDFASAEVPHSASPASTSVSPILIGPSSDGPPQPPPPPSSETLPPPPPLPNFGAAASPLQRAASMPEIKIQKPDKGRRAAAAAAAPAAIVEEGEEVEVEESEKLVRRKGGSGGSNGGSGNSNRGRGNGDRRNKHKEPEHDHVVQHGSALEYFFPPMDSVPGTTLGEPVVEQERSSEQEVAHEEVEEQERPPVEVVVEEEKAVEVPVPTVEKRPMGGKTGLNFMQIFVEIDDHFLKASESAHEVSKMLEATRLHFHSNFADNRGHIDHSARVMRVITWNRSFKGIPDVDDGKDDFDLEENETHATVLDKILAWEKKLYDEVKAGEIMKYEYQKKVAMLNKQKKRAANPESLEKLKAAVSHLHTRYIVDMQSMDSTVSEIDRLRDEQLHPKLVQLVDGMATMWETMRMRHEAKSKIVNALRYLDLSHSPRETTEHHFERTYQLCAVAQEWHKQFCNLIDNQKNYIKALNNWLKLNLIPIESSLKEKVSSPPRVVSPPIQSLLVTWQDFLDKLPDEVARSAISGFAAVMDAILKHQEEEMKLKEKCEETRKELNRKTRQFEDWLRKYLERKIPEELDPERSTDGNAHDETVTERQFIVETLKKRLEEEEEAYQKHCLQVREKSLASMKTRLPDLFRAMTDVAQACSQMYRNLRSISQRRSARHSSSS